MRTPKKGGNSGIHQYIIIFWKRRWSYFESISPFKRIQEAAPIGSSNWRARLRNSGRILAHGGVYCWLPTDHGLGLKFFGFGRFSKFFAKTGNFFAPKCLGFSTCVMLIPPVHWSMVRYWEHRLLPAHGGEGNPIRNNYWPNGKGQGFLAASFVGFSRFLAGRTLAEMIFF